MPRRNPLGSESLKIKVNDDKVAITFNAQNWDYTCSKLLIAIAIHAENRNIPVANHMKDALKLKLREISPSQESYDQYIRLCERLEASENRQQNMANNDELNIGEPK